MSKSEEKHIVKATYGISSASRAEQNRHLPLLIWLTGLSGSGKSTLANSLEMELHDKGVKTYHLDGDNLRKGINSDLGFSMEDRSENIRRIAEIGALFLDAGLVVTAAFISPLKKDRERVRDIVGRDRLLEVFVDCPLEMCEKRDVKGLYQKAREGLITDFTGIDSPYESPDNPDLHLYTDRESIDQCVRKMLDRVLDKIKLQH